MKKHTCRAISLVMLVWVATSACMSEEPRIVMVQPGTTTRPLGPLFFENAHQGDNAEEVPLTTCAMAQNAGSVALIEFTGEPQLVPREDCSGPYAGDAWITPAQVYGVLAGDALPSSIDLVSHSRWDLGGLHPKPGAVWLVTTRQAQDQWFLAKATPVALDGQGEISPNPPGGYTLAEEFPSGFQALSERFEEIVGDLEGLCPREASRRLDDTEYALSQFDPSWWIDYEECHPDSNPPENSSEIPEEDLPPSGGTDDSVEP